MSDRANLHLLALASNVMHRYESDRFLFFSVWRSARKVRKNISENPSFLHHSYNVVAAYRQGLDLRSGFVWRRIKKTKEGKEMEFC